MQDFQSALLCCGLVDLGFQGYKYTWRNGKYGDAFIEQRLDRACASLDWRELFLQAKVFHTSAFYSNHDLIVLDNEDTNTGQRHKTRIHQFKEKWVAHPECEERIRSSWTHSLPMGSPMFCLFEKIKRCRTDLVAWS